MIAHLRALSQSMLAIQGATDETVADAQDLALIADAMEAGRPVEVDRPGFPPVPWLPDRPLYIPISEFDTWDKAEQEAPRFICDRLGIPVPNRRTGPIVHEAYIDRCTLAEARERAMGGRCGRGAIARLVIVEAEL